MLFTGTFEYRIDAKNRLAIPRELRECIDTQRDGHAFYVTIQELGSKLGIYTEAEFKRQADLLEESDLSAEELLVYEYVFFKHAHRVIPDAQSRIKIPDLLMQKTGLESKDVVVSGVRDHIQVEDRAAHNERLEKILVDNPKILGNMRLKHRRAKPLGE